MTTYNHRTGFLTVASVQVLQSAINTSIPDLKSSIEQCKKLRGGGYNPSELAQAEQLLASLKVGRDGVAGWLAGEG